MKKTAAGQLGSVTSHTNLIALVPAALLLIGFFWAPLAGTILDSLRVPGGWSLNAYLELAQDAFPRILSATVADSAIVTVGCILLGLPAAYALSRIDSRWLPPLILAITVPLFVSSLIRSYSWVAILGNRGLINQALMWAGIIRSPIKLVYTQSGMIAAMIQVQLPLFILPAYSVMRRIDRRVVQAAQSLGADPATAFFTAFLPLALPGVIVAAMLVFVGSLGFFETPALLGPPGAYFISQSIEVRVNSLGDQSGAAAQAMVLLLMVVLLAALAIAPIRKTFGSESPRIGTAEPPSTKSHQVSFQAERILRRLSPYRWYVLGPLSIGVVILMVLPLVILVPLAFSNAPYLSFPPTGFSLRWFQAYFANDQWIDATIFSIWIGGCAAAIATVAGGLAVLAIMNAPTRTRITVLAMGAAPLIVSPMVLAVSIFYIAAWMGLLGTPIAIIGAYALMGLPYPILIIGSAMMRLDQSLLRAATSLGAKPTIVVLTVVIPILATAIISALLFAFVTAFNDLSVALFLSSNSTRTLPLLMWDDIRQEITPRMAAVAVVLLVAGSVVYGGIVSTKRAYLVWKLFGIAASRVESASLKAVTT